MRIAVWSATGNANAYYRALRPVAELARRGHRVDEPSSPAFTAFENGGRPDWDVLVLHQALGDDAVATATRLREQGVAVVWDTDDDVGKTPRGSRARRRHGGRRGMRRFFARSVEVGRAASLMTTTNAHLANVYRAAGVERIAIFPNYIDASELARPRRRHAGIVIGIVAAEEHRHDLRKLRIARALETVLASHDGVRVVSIGADPGIKSHRHTHIPRVPFAELLDHVRGFDIGLAPLRDTAFNRSRSDIKLKEYAAGGAMWLASPVGPYAGMGEDQGGILVPDGAWHQTLSELIVDHDRRRRLAAAARAWARTQTIQAHAARYERLLREAIAYTRSKSPGRPRARLDSQRIS